MDQAGHAGPGESVSDLHAGVQPEGGGHDPAAPGQNPAHAEGKLSVRLAFPHTPLDSDHLSSHVTVKPVFPSHRFITPNHKSDLDTTPRTPTPFKNAMEKYGPLRPLVRQSHIF